MTRERSVERLRNLFAAETVVDFPRIRTALGDASAMTAFRYLRQLPYRRSYNRNGRYYCLYEPSRHDRFGLWCRVPRYLGHASHCDLDWQAIEISLDYERG